MLITILVRTLRFVLPLKLVINLSTFNEKAGYDLLEVMREVIKGMVTLPFVPLRQPVFYLLKIAPQLAKIEPICLRITL